VRKWRSQRRISQEELAGRAGLHRTYVSDIERGARNVSLESIEKLARALEVPAGILFAEHSEDSGETISASILTSNELVDILLVEDNRDDVQLTLHALNEAKIANRIHVVRDGAEALDFLFATGSYSHRHMQDRPQIILLDLELPKINGMEVLQRIKADSRTQTIPVVILTASRQHRDIATGRRLGAEGYIVKPVDFQNLSAVTPRLSLHWALLKPSLSARGT
jgi:CheY-like chemotaxis protein/DNA-binding XRE family transcriptional regulator